MSDLDLDARRKRIRFRAWHRGLRELELLMGRFVDAHGAAFDGRDILDFERLLDAPDQAMLATLLGQVQPGQAALDTDYDSPVFQRLRAFCETLAG